jgi:acyl-coenzyme A synthetase/AMP-(fatty) acid ligase
VVLRSGLIGDDTLAQTLQTFVKESIAPYKYPRRVVFVDQLPKTSTGKLQRFRLRQLDGLESATESAPRRPGEGV